MPKELLLIFLRNTSLVLTPIFSFWAIKGFVIISFTFTIYFLNLFAFGTSIEKQLNKNTMTVRILTPLLLLLTLSWAQAQNITPSSVPTITTKGYAETEVTPDIVYLSVSLKEFYEDGNLRKKVTIDELEKQLYESAMKIGVGKED